MPLDFRLTDSRFFVHLAQMKAKSWPPDGTETVERKRFVSEVRREAIAAMREELKAGADPGEVLTFTAGSCMPLELVREFAKDPRWAYDARRQAFVSLGAEVTGVSSAAPVAGSWKRTLKPMSRKKGFLSLVHPGIGCRIIVSLPDEEGVNA